MTAIRLCGHHHATHADGEVLTIADEATVRCNPTNVVTLSLARELVAQGCAELIGEWPEEAASGQVAHSPADESDGAQDPDQDPDLDRAGGEPPSDPPAGDPLPETSGQVAHSDPLNFGAPAGERPEEGDDDPAGDPDEDPGEDHERGTWGDGVDGEFD